MAPWWVGGLLDELVMFRLMMNLSPPSVDDQTRIQKDLSKGSSVITLDPYVPDPLPQRGERNKGHPKLKKNVNSYEILPGHYESTSYYKFFVVKPDEGRRIQDLDMFTVYDEIVSAIGREPKIMTQGDGSLLIETASTQENEKLQSLTSLDGISVKCAPHRSLNQSKGIIRSSNLMKYTEERLLKEFESQKVVDVKQMKKKIDGVLTPIPTYILTFDLLRLPQKIKAAWLNLDVRPYIPVPRRCYYCQRFGHVSNSCRRKLKGDTSICNNCGNEEHGVCSNPFYCINCTEGHPASSKVCDRYILEREIQVVRTKEHISFAEAKKKVLSQYIRPGVSFASVMDKSRSAIVPKSIPLQVNKKAPTKTVESNNKRQLSDNEEDDSPLSKSNRFDALNDEMDFNVQESQNCSASPMLASSLVSCSPGPVVTQASPRITVQAEVHVPPSPLEQKGVGVSADLGESAEVLPSDDLPELSGAQFSGGSLEPPEVVPLDGSGETSGVISVGSEEPTKTDHSTDSSGPALSKSVDPCKRVQSGKISKSNIKPIGAQKSDKTKKNFSNLEGDKKKESGRPLNRGTSKLKR